jgi:polysaccharide pyruvyl transferase WcaK-like protein
MTHSSKVLVLENDNLTPSLVKGILGKAFGAVGVSYHFCTFALGQGVPTVCIHDGNYYLQKARGLSEFWGDKRLSLPLKGMNTDLAIDHIAEVFNDDLLRKKLHDCSIQAVESWKHIFSTQVRKCFG